MYCILVTGIPAAGKSTMAAFLGEQLQLPVLSKDGIKELLYDTVGFRSRAEKVRLGTAAMDIMYYTAEQLMSCRQAFILENNFEHASREGLAAILDRHSYQAITVTLTGDLESIYRRFLERNQSPDRHRGHVVNDRYPEDGPSSVTPPPSFEDFTAGIAARGMDTFTANGPQIMVDTTDLDRIDREELLKKLRALLHEAAAFSGGECFT